MTMTTPGQRKARLTSVGIWRISMNEFSLITFRIQKEHSLYPDGDPDRHQNLTTCSLAHC